MADNVFKRVRRLISAGVNDVVDSLEQARAPALMRETIREVDDAVRDMDERLGNIGAEMVRLEKLLKWLRKRHEEQAGKLELAIRQERDDLATAVIAEQMDIEQEIAANEKALARLMDEMNELKELRRKAVAYRRELAERYQAWMQAHPETEEPAAGEAEVWMHERRFEEVVNEAEATFRRATGRLFHPDASVAPSRAALMRELDELEREREIRRRLEDARRRLATG